MRQVIVGHSSEKWEKDDCPPALSSLFLSAFFCKREVAKVFRVDRVQVIWVDVGMSEDFKLESQTQIHII